jgi:putative DNA primase/helicase
MPDDDGPPAYLDDYGALPCELPNDMAPAFAERAMSIAPDWPEPMMPGAAKVEDIPADILQGWAGDMAAAVAASTQTPTAMSVMITLSVLASVLQRRFEVAPKGEENEYREPLSLWTLTAMQSGARKSAVIGALTAPLLRWEKREGDRVRSEISRVKSLQKVAESRIARLTAEASKAKDAATREQITKEIQQEMDLVPADVFAPRIFTGDTTAERLQGLLVEQGERFAVLSDEAGIFQIMAGMYSGGVGALDVFLQSHAGSAVRVDRAGRLAHLDRPALSFGLALQPGILANVAGSRQFRDSGLLARFLYAIPPSTVGKRNVRHEAGIPEGVRLCYADGIGRLLEGVGGKPGKPRCLPFSSPAKEAWLDFCEDVESQQGEGGRFYSVCDWTSKLPGAAARIACLMELAEVGVTAEDVSHDAMSRALRLARILIGHALAAFDLLGADPVEENAAALLTWARGNAFSEFSQRECMTALSGRFRQKEPLEKVVKMLQDRDVLRIQKRANKGARASVVYLLNPRCLSL